MCRLGGDEGGDFSDIHAWVGGDDGGKDIQCKWFELVNSGRLYRI